MMVYPEQDRLCYSACMSGKKWSWEKNRLGWWFGRTDGFEGSVAVFYREHSLWCAKVEIAHNAIRDLVHFSEGHVTENVAMRTAEIAAETSLRIRGRLTDSVPRV